MSATASPSLTPFDSASPAGSSASPLSRTDPANVDLPVTEPIDIASMLRLLLDRDI